MISTGMTNQAGVKNESRPHSLSRALSKVSTAALAVALAGFGNVAHAQTATTSAPSTQTEPEAQLNTSGLQDIIVTAEKRSTSLQRTPIAITALSAETVRDHQISDLKDVQALVPNFKMGDAEGVSQITVRGVGSNVFKPGSEGEVAVNENEVYIARGVAQQTGLFDVSSIEVLRGPQGTLYGRNASAGAVNITTARPTDQLAGYGDVTVGNYGAVRLEGAVGGPINDQGTLSVRVAGFRETRGGYGHNVVTGADVENKDAYGVRGTIVIKPTSNLQAALIVEYYHQQDRSGQFHYFGPAGLSGLQGASGIQPLFLTRGGFAPSDSRDIAYPFDGSFGLRTLAITGIVDWKSDGPFSIRSITGYRRQRAPFTFELDGGSSANVFGFSDEPAQQFSQELQLHYDTNSLHVTAGGYYFHEKDDVTPQYFVFSDYLMQNILHIAPVAPYVRFLSQVAYLRTNAYAGFGQATYNVTSRLSLTAGIRYSTETKQDTQQFGFQPSVPYPSSAPFPSAVALPDATFSSWTPKFGAQFQITPRVLLYASYAQGFKSGGYDVGVATPAPYRPERLTSYETGLKSTLAGGNIRANITGFYYNYTDLQVQQVVGLAVQTSNAATAKVYGVEGEFSFLLSPAFEIDASGSWTHARYSHFCGADGARPNIVTPASCAINGVLPPSSADFGGNTLTNAPDWRAYTAAQYTQAIGSGSLIFRGELEYSGRFFFQPDNFSFLSQSPYAKVDLSLTYKSSARWQVRAFAKNIADITTKTSALVATSLIGSPIIGSLAPPRTFGGQLTFKF